MNSARWRPSRPDEYPVPPLTERECRDYPALAKAREVGLTMRCPPRPSKGALKAMRAMYQADGPLVFATVMLPEGVHPLCTEDPDSRAIVMQEANCALAAFSKRCAPDMSSAYRALQRDKACRLHLHVVFPRSALTAEIQARLCEYWTPETPGQVLGDGDYVALMGESDADFRRVAKYISRFYDDRIHLPESHPDRLALLEALAQRAFSRLRRRRVPLAGRLPRTWLRARAGLLRTRWRVRRIHQMKQALSRPRQRQEATADLHRSHPHAPTNTASAPLGGSTPAPAPVPAAPPHRTPPSPAQNRETPRSAAQFSAWLRRNTAKNTRQNPSNWPNRGHTLRLHTQLLICLCFFFFVLKSQQVSFAVEQGNVRLSAHSTLLDAPKYAKLTHVDPNVVAGLPDAHARKAARRLLGGVFARGGATLDTGPSRVASGAERA